MRSIAQGMDFLTSLLRIRWAHIVAVDLFQYEQRVRLIRYARAFFRRLARIVPRQGEQSLVAPLPAARVQFFQAFAQVVDKPEIGPRISRWINRLVAPLEHTLRIGECPLLLRRSCGGHEEDFGFDLARIDRAAIRAVTRLLIPERRRFYFVQV